MVGQIISSAIGGAFGIAGENQRFEHEKQLAEQQNQYNLDMWRMQNEYNSPAAQMQRFKEAGLNPNLIYGQGSNGNAQSAPHMVTPRVADYSQHMAKLGELFNIEGLKTQIAQRKEAEANADNAKTNARRNYLTLRAEENFGTKWTYDYDKGKYVLRPVPGQNEATLVNPSAYYFNRILEGNYNRAALIPYRAAMLAPQIDMLNYDRLYYPISYWINNGSRALNAVSNFIPRLPVKFNRPPMQYQPPFKRVTTYY